MTLRDFKEMVIALDLPLPSTNDQNSDALCAYADDADSENDSDGSDLAQYSEVPGGKATDEPGSADIAISVPPLPGTLQDK